MHGEAVGYHPAQEKEANEDSFVAKKLPWLMYTTCAQLIHAKKQKKKQKKKKKTELYWIAAAVPM